MALSNREKAVGSAESGITALVCLLLCLFTSEVPLIVFCTFTIVWDGVRLFLLRNDV
jgi:hypothetical protein